MRAHRQRKKAAGSTLLEKAEREGYSEVRGPAGNGYLSGRLGGALGYN
jgi:hypothetical protein